MTQNKTVQPSPRDTNNREKAGKKLKRKDVRLEEKEDEVGTVQNVSLCVIIFLVCLQISTSHLSLKAKDL
jgi:hypothetical protein